MNEFNIFSVYWFISSTGQKKSHKYVKHILDSKQNIDWEKQTRMKDDDALELTV